MNTQALNGSGFTPAFAAQVNVASRASVEAAAAATVQAVGPIAILVNNAGVNDPVIPVWDYPDGAWDKVLTIDRLDRRLLLLPRRGPDLDAHVVR